MQARGHVLELLLGVNHLTEPMEIHIMELVLWQQKMRNAHLGVFDSPSAQAVSWVLTHLEVL